MINLLLAQWIISTLSKFLDLDCLQSLLHAITVVRAIWVTVVLAVNLIILYKKNVNGERYRQASAPDPNPKVFIAQSLHIISSDLLL